MWCRPLQTSEHLWPAVESHSMHACMYGRPSGGGGPSLATAQAAAADLSSLRWCMLQGIQLGPRAQYQSVLCALWPRGIRMDSKQPCVIILHAELSLGGGPVRCTWLSDRGFRMVYPFCMHLVACTWIRQCPLQYTVVSTRVRCMLLYT